MKEEWKEFGPENCYRVSSYGKVQSRLMAGGKYVKNRVSDSWKELRQVVGKTDNHGGYYLMVSSKDYNGKNRSKRIHRLVAENFLPNTNNFPEVNHIDGNRENNRADNLEWCTRQHNATNAKERGSFKGLGTFKGTINSPEKLMTAYTYLVNGHTNSEVAEIMGMETSQISRIKSGDNCYGTKLNDFDAIKSFSINKGLLSHLRDFMRSAKIDTTKNGVATGLRNSIYRLRNLGALESIEKGIFVVKESYRNNEHGK